MAAISQARLLSPFSQFEQFCTSIGSVINSICERSDTAFQRVHVMKKDSEGNIKLYDRKVKAEGQTEVRYEKFGTLSYIEDVKTGNLYKDEPEHIVAFKCALLALTTPFYTFGKMSWYVCKTPIEITTIALDTLIKAGQEFVYCRFYECAVELGRGFSQLPGIIGDGLFEIVKAPIFGLGVELAALYGIVKPYHARKFEAIMESAWQKGASYKDDFRNIPARGGENCWQAFMKDVRESHPFYLAHCFQARGNVSDPSIIVIRREAF